MVSEETDAIPLEVNSSLGRQHSAWWPHMWTPYDMIGCPAVLVAGVLTGGLSMGSFRERVVSPVNRE